MISEFVLNIVFNILSTMLALLPDVNWTVDVGSMDSFMDYISLAAYFFPLDTLVSIFAIIIGIHVFRIVVSLIKTIWELLPLV